jgi:O-antigen/teichoic acid export membrane protein
MFKFGFPLGLNSGMTFILTRVDRLILGALAGTVGVASYDVASRIPENARNFYQSFESVYFPNMAELFGQKNFVEFEKVLNNSLRFIGFVTSFASLILVLFQKEIVVILFSERYLSSAPALSLLMVAMGIALAGNLVGTSLVALGQSDKPVKINLVGTVTTIVGNFVMIPLFGFMGAVYTVLFSRCATLPLNFFFMRKSDIGIKVSEYLKPFGTFVLCAMVFVLLNSDAIILRSFLIFMFLMICSVLSVIKKEDFSLLRMELQQSIIGLSRFQNRKP